MSSRFRSLDSKRTAVGRHWRSHEGVELQRVGSASAAATSDSSKQIRAPSRFVRGETNFILPTPSIARPTTAVTNNPAGKRTRLYRPLQGSSGASGPRKQLGQSCRWGHARRPVRASDNGLRAGGLRSMPAVVSNCARGRWLITLAHTSTPSVTREAKPDSNIFWPSLMASRCKQYSSQ